MGDIDTKVNPRAGYFDVWEGVRVPRQVTARFDVSTDGFEDLPYDIELDLAVDGGRLVCESLHCRRRAGGPAVTGEGIRQLPIARMAREAAKQVATHPAGWGTDTTVYESEPEWTRELVAGGPTDQTLRAVAMEYRWAQFCGSPPTKSVMETFGVSRATAGRWVALARARGFLGRAKYRRAGEMED